MRIIGRQMMEHLWHASEQLKVPENCSPNHSVVFDIA